jgi:hypothetical protein
VPDHAAHRDRFEIISICIDCEGGCKYSAPIGESKKTPTMASSFFFRIG